MCCKFNIPKYISLLCRLKINHMTEIRNMHLFLGPKEVRSRTVESKEGWERLKFYDWEGWEWWKVEGFEKEETVKWDEEFLFSSAVSWRQLESDILCFWTQPAHTHPPTVYTHTSHHPSAYTQLHTLIPPPLYRQNHLHPHMPMKGMCWSNKNIFV
jgi:hypothetical protein